MKHRNIYITLVIITFIMAFVILHIGNVVTQLVIQNDKYTKENVAETYIDSGSQLLKYARENMVKELQNNADQNVLIEYTKSLKISPIISECAIVQLSPKTDILWSTQSMTINEFMLNDIQKNIDSSDVYNNIYKIIQDNKVIIWTGIPHGTIEYKNIKWVLVAEIDTSLVLNKLDKLNYYKNLALKLVNIIAVLSSISTVVLSLSIAFIQREFYKNG